jgi:hypothetical protein
MCEDYHNVDDTPSIIPNCPNFHQHRHDQSLFSLLVKKNNLDSKNIINNNNKNIINIHNINNNCIYTKGAYYNKFIKGN